MKKILLMLLCLAITFSVVFSVSGTAVAESNSDEYKQSEIYQFLSTFLLECPTRSTDQNQYDTAYYLKQEFDKLLVDVGAESTVYIVTYSSNSTYNVQVDLKSKSNTDKTVVIGAHYDATGTGANDNASGITALYFVLKNLAPKVADLPFNITFIAFGGEESGLVGSRGYLNQLSDTAKSNILMMFNFDVIANGDNLYVFSENKATSIAKLVLKNASGVEVKEKPYSQGINSALDYYGYGYYETIQGSDYTPFRLQGIPSVMFFSGNYVAQSYVESADSSKNTMNSSLDTLENLEKNGGEFVDKIQTVIQTTCNTILSSEFLGVCEGARSELMNNDVVFNSWWPRITACVLLVLLAVFAWLYSRKLEKQSIMGTAEVKNETVFATPKAEDIFSFDDGTQSKDDTDDIFDLKK